MDMYYKFYSLKEKPFKLAPDPKYLFLNKSLEKAFLDNLNGSVRDGMPDLNGKGGSTILSPGPRIP
jgi:hypothetical protein